MALPYAPAEQAQAELVAWREAMLQAERAARRGQLEELETALREANSHLHEARQLLGWRRSATPRWWPDVMLRRRGVGR